MKSSVPIGPATLVGYALSFLGVVGTVVSAAGTNLHLSTESIGLITAGTAIATNFLRSWQAHAAIKAGK